MRRFFLEFCAGQQAHLSSGVAGAQLAVVVPIVAGSVDSRPECDLTDDDVFDRILRLAWSG
eukprot:978437-Pyramimonas_sp.AAC.1